jgi:pectin methylesterase-like acyl-CoA thioesterase
MRLLALLGLFGFALGQTTTASAPAATYTVGPSQTYTNVTSAYKALPNDGQSYAIFVQAGVYTEQFNITVRSLYT